MNKKALRYFASIMVLAMTAVFAGPALAQISTRSLTVSREAKLGDQVLAQGKYMISFDEKKDGELVLTKDGREVTKSAYKLVELSKDASDSAVVFTAGTDGSLKIRRIELKGKKVALQID